MPGATKRKPGPSIHLPLQILGYGVRERGTNANGGSPMVAMTSDFQKSLRVATISAVMVDSRATPIDLSGPQLRGNRQGYYLGDQVG